MQQKPHPSIVQSNDIECDNVIYHSEKLEEQMADVCYRALKEQGTSAWIKCIRPTFKHYLGLVKKLHLSLKQKFELFIIQLAQNYVSDLKMNEKNIMKLRG